LHSDPDNQEAIVTLLLARTDLLDEEYSAAFERAKAVIEAAGGSAMATVQICDRLEAIVDLGIPNYSLAEYGAPENYRVGECPLCKAGVPVTSF
jgi:hypothetical protein